MKAALLTLLGMSASASVVILAVLLIRGILIAIGAPRKYAYLLWLAVGFRLLCPFSFSSAVSLFWFTPLRAVPAEAVGVTASKISLPPSPGDSILAPVRTTAEAMGTPSAPDALTIFFVIWLIGAAGVLFRGIVTFCRIHCQMRTATRLEGNVWQSEYVDTPFIINAFAPKIFLPYHLDEETMECVLLHERYHLRRRDHVVKLVTFLVMTVHWFNPLCWLAATLMERDMELSCDEGVMAKHRELRRAYSLTLLSFGVKKRLAPVTPLAFGQCSVERRIRNVLDWERPGLWKKLAAVALCAAALASCSLNPATVRGEPVNSVEDYAENALTSIIGSEVVYHSLSAREAGAEDAHAAATILDAKTASLEKLGELGGITPNGVLELWHFQYLTRLSVDDPADVYLPDGVSQEDDWFDISAGQEGNYIIALRLNGGGHEVIYSDSWSKIGDIDAFHSTAEEFLSDWYATVSGDNRLRYMLDWEKAASADRPDWKGELLAHRFDGDGWYLYVPVTGWSGASDGMGWQSQYGTGASLTVEKRTESPKEMAALWKDRGLAPVGWKDGYSVAMARGSGETRIRCCPASDGGCWEVTTVTPPIGYQTAPCIGVEPAVLGKMAESFTVLS